MHNETTRSTRIARWASNLWEGLCDYFGLRRRRDVAVTDRAELKRFLMTRASYVAQTSLYGYLRTRAGMIYPQLFDDDAFVGSVNIAKWQVWLACLSDLSVYAGGLLTRGSPAAAPKVGALLHEAVKSILDETGTPPDSGGEFASGGRQVLARLAACDWARITDDESAFAESPTALVRWAPVIENLKELDEEIVRNSVRFHWQEVRRELRRLLDPDALLQATP